MVNDIMIFKSEVNMREHLQEGTCILNRYKVERLLGEGGMGAVYLCCDLEVEGKVWALKEMCLDRAPSFYREQGVMQFKREVQILATLNHPNLPHISHFFHENNTYYLVMEYVEGKNLAEALKERGGPIKEQDVVSWAVQICDVLEYLHNQQPNPIIYRDLKPSNVMLTSRGQIKLIDFGIARFSDPCKVTDTFKMGSVGFSPPEQYRGKGTTDGRSDIYSLGATLHFLLTGRDPQDEAPFSFPPLRTLIPTLSPKIDRIVMKALEYKKEKRFESAGKMKEALLEEEGLLWNNAVTRKILSSPKIARFLENPAAQRDRVAMLVVLLFILTMAICVDAIKVYNIYSTNRKKEISLKHYDTAQYLESRGLYREAIREYEESLRAYRYDIRSQHEIGVLYCRLSLYDDAESAFTKALKIEKKYHPSMRELAFVHYKRGDCSKSIELLMKARQIEPKDPVIHYYFGLTYEKLGKNMDAVHEFHEYLISVPGAPDRKEIELKIESWKKSGTQ
ncbi:MAG: protein kinase [Candidatus Xenobiia bacterium LiM19]